MSRTDRTARPLPWRPRRTTGADRRPVALPLAFRVPERRSLSNPASRAARARSIRTCDRTSTLGARAIASIEPSSASVPSGVSIVSAGRSRRVPSKASRPATVPDSVVGRRIRRLRAEADGERARPEGARGVRCRGRVDREIDRPHQERPAAHLVIDADGELSDLDEAEAQRCDVRGGVAAAAWEVERSVSVTDDREARPVEFQLPDLDLAQDQAASQHDPKAVGAQQGAPIFVVQRCEGDVAKLGGRAEEVVVQALRADVQAELACGVGAYLVQHAGPDGAADARRRARAPARRRGSR